MQFNIRTHLIMKNLLKILFSFSFLCLVSQKIQPLYQVMFKGKSEEPLKG
jgi:hypothetical protein